MYQFNRNIMIKNMFAIFVLIRRLTHKKLRIKRKQKGALNKQGGTCDGSKDNRNKTEAGLRILPEDHHHQPSNSQTSLQDLIAIAQKEMFSDEEGAYIEFDKDSCYHSETESNEDIYEEMAFYNLSMNNNDLYMTMVFQKPSV